MNDEFIVHHSAFIILLFWLVIRHLSLLLRVDDYFNYFTEIEECFRRCRGTPTLLSTLDWALIEAWKEAGVPLEAVLVGIERSFEKFKKRPQRFRKVNSLAYCSQEVLRAAEDERTAAVERGEVSAGLPGEAGAKAPFEREEIRGFIERNVETLEKALRTALENGQAVLAEDLTGAVRDLREAGMKMAQETPMDLEELEGYLSALEEKLAASFTRASSVELLALLRKEVEKGLFPYRRKISAAQVESLERQFLKNRLFDHFHIPRLSLFYL